jgi:predicted O-methyltransferase YrrM
MTPAVRGGLDSKGKSKLISGIAEQWPRHRTFVETGSACGDQVLLLAERFDRLVTIEMDADYFQSAQHRTRY